jgi:hypothetical protein
MKEDKLTLRIDANALEAAKRHAEQHNVSVASLVEVFFRSLKKVGEISADTPILSELTGSLRSDTNLEDYQEYIEEKYRQKF